MIQGATVLLTGGAGFIGTHLVERLHAANRCVIYDTLRRDALGPSGLLARPNVELVRGDVRDAAALRQAAADADVVIHLASIAGVDTVRANPVQTMEIALLGTYHALEAARASGRCRRFVDFSTSEVFGRYAFRVSEGDTTQLGAVGEARWTYAVSKLATEHLGLAYHKEKGLPVSVVRPFNVYGPGQVGEGALRAFIQRALRNETIQIHGDGTQIRAWCYVDDMVDGVLLAMSHPKAVGESFNIGNQRTVTTIYGLAAAVTRILGSRSKIEFIRKDYADIELRVPEVAKARELLGFEAKVDLEEGILRTAEFYRARMVA